MEVVSPNNALLAAVPGDVWLTIVNASASADISSLELLDFIGSESYKRYHKLRLVCKHFNSLFQRFPQLSEDIWLRQGYPATVLPSLLSRMQRNSGSIASLISWRKQTDVLSCAVQHAVQLRKVVLQEATAANVALLSALSTLQCCELCQPGQETLDLQPIGALMRLQRLKLCHGWFSNLQFAAHLTSLEIVDAQASSESEHQLATSLRELVLSRGHLTGVHRVGLSACTNLQRLVGNTGSYVSAGSDSNELDLRMFSTHIPAALCKLVNLTEFSLTINSDNHIELDMQWLYQLTALQSLDMYLTNVAMTIGQELTQLSRLSTLLLNSDECRIDFQWQSMRALQCVMFGRTIDFWADMFDLLRVKNL